MSRGKPFDGADVSIEFREFERNRLEELPQRAYFGEFSYWPKQPKEEHSSNLFTFKLNYIPGDARDLLIPILSQKPHGQVVLTLHLTKEVKDILAAADKLTGDVRHYNFEVQQDLMSKA